MFALLITLLFETMVAISIATIVFLIFFYLPIKHWLINRRKKSEKEKEVNNVLAPLILLSDSYKEIISFLQINGTYLNDEMLNKLLSRAEYLKADQFIKENDIKYRFKYVPELEEEVMIESEKNNEQSISN